ncbi:hypothetical protein D3C81_1925450 [compost metagenome]
MVSVAQIGNSLRVLLDAADDGSALTGALCGAGIDAQVHPQPASLEDVFVAATHNRAVEGAAT